MKKKKGFTLVELLVVIAIIGMLSTLATIALTSARRQARDARRISDIRQIQNALELHFADNESYPTAVAPGGTLGAGTYAVLCNDGFEDLAADCSGAVYMGQVPANVAGGGTSDYNYTSADGGDYTISFDLEGAVGELAAGAHTATPDGIQ